MSDAKKIEGGDGGNAWAWLSDEDSKNVCGRRRLQRSDEDDTHRCSVFFFFFWGLSLTERNGSD